ncbi:MAG TPA: caspase family protein [Saprospiraceae bacterium]|nr:caspase family protein [Saprospiraceae bacterium]
MLRTGLLLISICISVQLGSSQCLSGNCQTGIGKFRFQNGAVYEGQMAYGRLNGKGTLNYSNGDVYTGQWKLNKREGEGIFKTKAGLSYQGNFSNNQLNGKIKVFDQQGGYFEGNWVNGQPYGTGQYIASNGTIKSGEWSEQGFIQKNSLASKAKPEEYIPDCNILPCGSGKGRLVFDDGSVYTGLFYNGLPAGEGICKFVNGDLYSGLWTNGRPDGHGMYTYANGMVLNGDWKNGKFTEPVKAIKKSYAEGANIYALIVGASRYEFFESLKYTDDDAYKVYAFLRSPEGGAVPDDHIRILIDESAIAENIYKGLDDIIAMAGPDDEVLVYLAGHGLQGFYVPTNSDGYRNRVEYDDIKKRLSTCQARQKLVIADACYSGSLLAAKTPMFESVDLFYKKLSASGGGTAFLLSSKSEEYSLESQGLRQGIFSYYLVLGLKGEADTSGDSIVTLDELYTYVYAQVRKYSGNLQSPILAGDIDRSMPLANIRS